MGCQKRREQLMGKGEGGGGDGEGGEGHAYHGDEFLSVSVPELTDNLQVTARSFIDLSKHLALTLEDWRWINVPGIPAI